VIYNVPGRTGQDISPAIIEQIAGHHNFAGVKECMGNERVEAYTKQGITIWSGNDDECHDAR
jgi:4-hydroxy-tetrahydrodipicolinate synthase